MTELSMDAFSPVCCWTCKHFVLDVGHHGKRYSCQATGKVLKQNPHTPILCKQYLRG